MAFGRPKGAATLDALFTVPFLLAAIFNLAPAVYLSPTNEELIFVTGAHALFVVRLVFRQSHRRPAASGRFGDALTS